MIRRSERTCEPAGGARLTVALLGSLRVSVAGAPVKVTPDRLRTVLAVLALSAGDAVPVGQLVEAVWGEEQPANGRRALQVYVTRLRGVIGAAAIRTAPDGYALETEPDNVDALRFVRLLDEAAGSPDQATERARLVEALALWRGVPFADVKSAWLAEVPSTRLVEHYLSSVERLIDVDLSSGRTDDLVAQLRDLTARHPLRERFWGQLMRALWYTGRQADALEAYRSLYRLLADELGVEPGIDIQTLHRQILTDDAPAAGSRPSSPSVAIPRQLPADVAAFVGRDHELADLDRVPDAKTVVITAIDGMAGIGKTALAVHAAHRLASRFPDGQLFIDLHGYTQGVAPVDPGDALERMLRAVGVSGEQIPRHLDERAALFRSSLAGRAMVIVLDNAASEAQVAPLLPGSPGCLVLVTSRLRLTGLSQSHTLSLDTLSQADAVALFARTVGVERLAGEASALVAEAVDLCGRLPLAIRIAAARLRSRPAWRVVHLIERLREFEQRLAELAAGQGSVGAALDLSYRQLALDEQRAYRRLGLHSGTDIDVYAAAALTGTTPVRARRLLDVLLDAHLLQEPAPGRYRFHDLIRAHAAHAAATTDPEVDRRAAMDGLFDYYGRTATTAMDTLYPFESDRRPRLPPPDTLGPPLSEQREAAAWLDVELANLLATARHAVAHSRPGHVQHLSATLHRHLRTRARYTDANTLHDQALAAAQATGDRAGQVAALAELGDIHRRQGRHKQATADFERALEIARATGNHYGEVDALNGLGWVQRRLGRYEEATSRFEQALEITLATGDHSGQVDALTGLGDSCWARGLHAEACQRFEHALAVARASGNRIGQLDALSTLGHMYLQQGQHARATDNFNQTLAIARVTGHRNAELRAILGLGRIHQLHGRHERAIKSYERVLDLSRENGDRHWQFEAAQSLGRLHESAGQPSQALAAHQQALDLANELGHPDEQARAHDGLARAHRALDQYQRAMRHWQQALDILSDLSIEHTDDESVDAPTIRARLAGLRQVNPA